MIFGFVVDEFTEGIAKRAAACASACRPMFGGRLSCSRIGNVVVGQWYRDDQDADAKPATSDDGKRKLWFSGEAFAGPAEVGQVDLEHCHSLAFRRRLLAWLDAHGWSGLASLDGDFAIVVWDEEARCLSVAVDRFGLQRIFFGRGAAGFAFGSTVSAVLVGADVEPEPNLDALRDAISAGGYPLAPQTYVRDVRLASPHSVVSGDNQGSIECTRYWNWSALREVRSFSATEVVERSESLWKEAMARRTSSGRRFVQTLSGGLDSRLILDDGARRAENWLAVSYGVNGCDDCEFARAAAAAAGVRWAFHPLYSGVGATWIERRLEWILRTDGLVDFGNLMHTEVIDLLHSNGDAVLHGYIGDFVCGPTFQDCRSVDDLVAQSPYYGGSLAWAWSEYAERLEAARPPGDFDRRFLHCEQKLVSQTNALFASIHHAAPLRRPFVDHQFFDFWQSLPLEHRDGRTYRSWLSAEHSRVFVDVPWQKTGLPISASQWRLKIERGRRYAMRKLKASLERWGVRASKRQRQFFDDETAMRVPEARDLVERTVLGSDAIAANAWNRRALEDLIEQWHERAAAPVQQIGAILSFEYYHRELPELLRRLRSQPPLKEMTGRAGAPGADRARNAEHMVELAVP